MAEAALRDDNTRLTAELETLRQELAAAQQARDEAAAPAAMVAPTPLSLVTAASAVALGHKPRLPEYSGDVKGGLPWAQFLNELEVHIKLFGFDDRAAAQLLPRCLKGHALQYYMDTVSGPPPLMDDIDDEDEEGTDLLSSFAKIKLLLTEHFTALEGGSRYGSTAFYLKKQGPVESVIEFYTDLLKLAKRAYPDPTQPMPETQVLERFVRGLILPIRRAVIAREPASLEAALRLACKIQAQREMLLEDEPETRARANEVSEVDSLTSKIAHLSQQVSQILTPVSHQQSWGNPVHYFPPGYRGRTPEPINRNFGASRRGNFIPNNRTPPRPAPRRQVNQQGEARCWNCQKFGHYRSTCRAPPKQLPTYQNGSGQQRYPNQRPQINEIGDNVPSSPRVPTASRGSNLTSSPHVYLALFCCIMLISPVGAQRPMVCQTTRGGQLFEVPKALQCQFGSLNPNDTSTSVTYQIYKRNLIKYASNGFLCKAVYSEARLFTYLFGIEHLKEFKTNPVSVSPKLCQALVRDKISPSGPLRPTHEGVWQTQNDLNWRTPSWTADECCRWWQWDVVNYYVIPVTVYSRHGKTEFESTGADMSNCPSYRAGFCQVDKESLVWEVQKQWSCQYLPSLKLDGRRLGVTWLSNDGMLALTQTKARNVTDCGITLQISDQSLAYQTIDRNITRSKRQVESEEGVILSDQQASQLQALYTNVREESHFLYKHSLHMTCNSLQSIDALLHATVVSHPTLTMRMLLNDTYLFATACSKVIEVWPCSPLKKAEFTFKKQRSKCTLEVPVSFSFQNQTHDGYLNPITLIVSHHGTPDDCSRISSIPITLFKKTWLYKRYQGVLEPVRQITPLKLITYQTEDDFDSLMPVEIFKPVVLYNWPELIPNSSLNALWHTTRAKTAMLETLRAYFKHDESQDDSTQSNGGLALNSIFLISDPFHIWLAITCAVINICLAFSIISFCRRRALPKLLYAKCKPVFRFRQNRRPINDAATGVTIPGEDGTELMSISAEVVESLDEVERRYRPEVNETQDYSNPLTIDLYVGGKRGSFLIDSGSSISLLATEFASSLMLPICVYPLSPSFAVSVSGEPLEINGTVNAPLIIGNTESTHVFHVYSKCRHDGIIGLDILAKIGPFSVDLQAQELRLGSTRFPLNTSAGLKARVTVQHTQTLAPRAMAVVQCTLPSHVGVGNELLFEQDADKYPDLLCPRTLVESDLTVPIRVINFTHHPVTLYASSTIGQVEAVQAVETLETPVRSGDENVSQSLNIPGLNLDSTVLSEVERVDLAQLLQKYKHLFADSDTDLPGTDVCEHKIVVTDQTPIKLKSYRVPQAQRGALDEKIDSMLEAGIISPSCSPWASPVVLVTKPDGSLRVCIDYRRLNGVSVPDAHPLPRIDDAMQFLSGAKYLSTLDLYAGYHQVSVAPDSRQYTAFITERGLFEFNRLSFGLRNAPSTFARLMNFVLTGLLFSSAIVYLDDVLIASKTFAEHLVHLEQVFQRLEHYNLRLKMKKCSWARKSLPFLGFTIAPEGILPDSSNVSKLRDMPAPSSVTQVRSFLGLCNYYRKFVEGYANIARPLVNLTKKASRFIWTEGCQKAFQSLINLLTNAPLLRYPKFDQEFILAVDASQYACGAMLSQMFDGKEMPLAYFSHTFQPCETRYSTVERELLAIVLALKHWKHFLYGHHVVIYSDQQSISWGIKAGDSPRLAKWQTQVNEYDHEIHYRPGPKNKPADFLSRLPGTGPEVSLISPDTWASFALNYGGFDLCKEQKKDPICLAVFKILENTLLLTEVPKGQQTQVKRLLNGCTLDEPSGCLATQVDNSPRFIVPSHLRVGILEQCHDSVTGGHLAFEKTLGKVLQRFHWPGVRADVHNWVQSCEICLTRRASTHPGREPLQPIEPVEPWHSVVIDILGPFPVSSKGNKYILVMMDRFTKWPECAAMRNQTATTVAKVFVSLIVTRHGVPVRVQSDRGTQFTSDLMREVSTLLGMKQVFSTAYHPQSQGLVERFNKTLCHMLKSFVAVNQKDWCSYLDLVLFAYRTSPHASTSLTPFELEHGRTARLPVQLLCPEGVNQPSNPSDYVVELRDKMAAANALAKANMDRAATAMKSAYDKRVYQSNIVPGDKVFISRPTPVIGLSPKLQPCRKGPFVVLERNGTTLTVKPVSGSSKVDVVHINDCIHATDRDVHLCWPEDQIIVPTPKVPITGATPNHAPGGSVDEPQTRPSVAPQEAEDSTKGEPVAVEAQPGLPRDESEDSDSDGIETSPWDENPHQYNLRPRNPMYYGD